LVGKSEKTRPLGRYRRSCEDNREIGLKGLNLLHLAQNGDQ